MNYTCQTYQLSRPNKVGAVMALIRECQPKTIEDKRWYFENAQTAGKNRHKVTEENLQELGERLHEKITSVVIPEWKEVFDSLTKEDCLNYIYNLTINRTFDGYLREKSVVYDGLVKEFPNLKFEESPPELDHSGDVDYIGYLNENVAIGIQIKPITALSNFGNYSPSERMKSSFKDFKEEFSGNVFIVYSLDGEIANKEVIDAIRIELERLKLLLKI